MQACNVIKFSDIVPVSARPENRIPPELDDLKAYFQEIGLPASEAERMFDYYESNGWRVGKNPMKNVFAAARNWRRNLERYGGIAIQKTVSPAKSVYNLKTIIEAKRAKMKELYDRFCFESPTGDDWGKNLKQQGEWLQLKKEVRILMDELSKMA